MAEQISHNVVDQPESTSGVAPLVDTAASHTITDIAENGLHSTIATNANFSSSDDRLISSKAQSDFLTDASAAGSTAVATDAAAVGSQAGAEPSAGNASAQLATEIVPAPSMQAEGDFIDGKTTAAQLANGVHGAAPSPDEALGLDISADPSVNSDTDTSRADALEQTKDGGQHMRTNSVKKPATFSKVSVTKNFLAKSVVSASAAAKPGDKSKHHLPPKRKLSTNSSQLQVLAWRLL